MADLDHQINSTVPTTFQSNSEQMTQQSLPPDTVDTVGLEEDLEATNINDIVVVPSNGTYSHGHFLLEKN